MSEEPTEQPDVVVCPDGPVLVRGAHVVLDADGRAHRAERPVVALCRCGCTAIPPWCDGTHKVVPWSG